MSPDDVKSYILNEFEGVVEVEAWGEASFFYNPGHALKRGTYFLTLKFKDGDNDRASRLNRNGVYRLNIGASSKHYEAIFGHRPQRPPKGGVVEGPWDFTELDMILPHPIYGWMGWMSVLNPSEVTYEACKPLMSDAYAKAQRVFERRLRSFDKG